MKHLIVIVLLFLVILFTYYNTFNEYYVPSQDIITITHTHTLTETITNTIVQELDFSSNAFFIFNISNVDITNKIVVPHIVDYIKVGTTPIDFYTGSFNSQRNYSILASFSIQYSGGSYIFANYDGYASKGGLVLRRGTCTESVCDLSIILYGNGLTISRTINIPGFIQTAPVTAPILTKFYANVYVIGNRTYIYYVRNIEGNYSLFLANADISHSLSNQSYLYLNYYSGVQSDIYLQYIVIVNSSVDILTLYNSNIIELSNVIFFYDPLFVILNVMFDYRITLVSSLSQSGGLFVETITPMLFLINSNRTTIIAPRGSILKTNTSYIFLDNVINYIDDIGGIELLIVPKLK